jgi:hypothetical protein
VPEQVELVRQCLAEPRIAFHDRTPNVDELRGVLDEGAQLLINVNARKLAGTAGYAGHIVFVHGYSDDQLAVEDPGPPARQGLMIDGDAFDAAWRSPTDGMANFIAVSAQPLQSVTKSTSRPDP